MTLLCKEYGDVQHLYKLKLLTVSSALQFLSNFEWEWSIMKDALIFPCKFCFVNGKQMENMLMDSVIFICVRIDMSSSCCNGQRKCGVSLLDAWWVCVCSFGE